MKRIITLILVLAVAVCSVASLSACTNGEYKKIGLSFYLPNDFEERTVRGCDYVSSNGEAEFTINAHSYETLKSATDDSGNYKGAWPTDVYSYARKFCQENGISFDKYTFDKDKNVADVKFVFDYPEVDEEGNALDIESEYCHYVVMDNGEAIYVISYSCRVSLMDTYKPLFDEWATKLVLDKVA